MHATTHQSGPIAPPYTLPIFAVICYVAGWVQIGLGIMGLILLLTSGQSGGVLGFTVLSVPVVIATLVGALLSFGTGQLVDFVGQIAHSTARTAEASELLAHRP